MKILIPMAGEGSRFQKEGYTFPKPLINVNGKPMIQSVVENLDFDCEYILNMSQKILERFGVC
jgi:NDP-sugar pyrophosphorylase family protein